MSKIRLLTIAVFALTAINIFFIGRSFLHRPPPPGLHHHGGKGGPEQLDRELNFDENQIQKHKELREVHRDNSEKLTEDLNNDLKSLYSLVRENSFSESKKDALLKRIEQKTTTINELNLNHFLNLKSILKPAQIEGFNKIIGHLGQEFDNRKKPPKK